MPLIDRLCKFGICSFLLRFFRRSNVENGMSKAHFDIPEYLNDRVTSNSIDRLRHRIDRLDRRIGSMDRSTSDRNSYIEDLEAQIDDIHAELSDLRGEIDNLEADDRCQVDDSDEDNW